MQSPDTHNVTIAAGLTNPINAGQVIFRRTLKAMSEPGTIVDIEHNHGAGDLSPAMYALALSLLDQQTTLYLSAALKNEEVCKNLQFHTDVQLVNDPQSAMFAIANADQITEFCYFNKGTDESPEMSCSLVLQVESLTNTAAQAQGSDNEHSTLLKLEGPGIESVKYIAIAKLSTQLLEYLTERPDAFPRGLDFYFVSDKQLVCLPRTTKVSVITTGDNPCM
ncbi:phosphonate C-P lyase system protein PhnH [Gammaproteobacteria bacterium AS21]